MDCFMFAMTSSGSRGDLSLSDSVVVVGDNNDWAAILHLLSIGHIG